MYLEHVLMELILHTELTETEDELEKLAATYNQKYVDTLAPIILHVAETIYHRCAESNEDISKMLITDNLRHAFYNIFWNTLHVNKKPANFISDCKERWNGSRSDYTGSKQCSKKAHTLQLGVSYFTSCCHFTLASLYVTCR